MAQYSDRNLIVNYLPQEFPDCEFHGLFATLGPVKRAKIVRDRDTGFSYGFGFVEYVNPEDAKSAILNFNGLRLQKKVLKVAFARLQGEETKNCNLHLEGLPQWVTPDELGTKLAKFGGIINCKILRDDTGKSRNQGFALFETRSAAEAALNSLNGRVWPDSNQTLVVRFAAENSKKVRAPNMTKGASLQVRNPNIHPPALPHIARGFTLYIYNIGKLTTDNELYSLFVQFGTVIEALVLKDKNRQISKNCGFVTYANYQSAMTAIQALNNQIYNGRRLQVSFKKSNNERQDGMNTNMNMNLNMSMTAMPMPPQYIHQGAVFPPQIYGPGLTHMV